jgi:hypothetical protein
MTTAAVDPVSDYRETFDEQGFVILRNFIDLEVVQGVREAVEFLSEAAISDLVQKGLVQDSCESEPFEARLIRVNRQIEKPIPLDFRMTLHEEGMYPLFFHRKLLDLVESILGPEIRLYPNYTVRPKLPDDEATLVLWHQDAGYTATNRHGEDSDEPSMDAALLRMVNVWSPLLPARVENGCMQFVPGSHKLGLVPHFQKNKFYLEIVEEVLKPRIPDAVAIELDPGDIVLFSNLLFHCGLPNKSNAIRWSCDWRYQDATQSTAREHVGHIARSKKDPSAAVRSPEEWAASHFV